MIPLPRFYVQLPGPATGKTRTLPQNEIVRFLTTIKCDTLAVSLQVTVSKRELQSLLLELFPEYHPRIFLCSAWMSVLNFLRRRLSFLPQWY